ncbi:imelysin family protein [Aquimarina sediminis]|uniref:imelysin family protein n=1 Tax=Aquimarina sediminis TaxID=2070536 RepID=UPI000CA0468E|nr:imelysin family protein [Aquimarina sediminis]
MKIKIQGIALIACAVLGITGCSDDDDNTLGNTVSKSEVIENYADIVYQSYKDSYDKALEMQTAINAFVDSPTENSLQAAKGAWLEAREPYGQTEAYRESSGPIDEGKTEGQLNAWPLDENYIDYVRDNAGGVTSEGIINTVATTIDETTLIGLNEGTGGNGVIDKNISTGYHAIEFLLWGQDSADPSNGLPGQRPYTDYVTDGTGTNQNQDRRGTYLKVVTSILVKDLKSLVDTWIEGGTYRTSFLKLQEDEAIKNMLSGIFFMTGEELSTERMAVAVEQNQEDEHSCFSDNTHRDIYTNAKGVNNVIFGEYGSIKGASIYDLVKQADAAQAEKLKSASDEATAKINAILNQISTKKFDQLIADETLTSNGVIMQAVGALKDQAEEISASASKINITL